MIGNLRDLGIIQEYKGFITYTLIGNRSRFTDWGTSQHTPKLVICQQGVMELDPYGRFFPWSNHL